MIDLTLLSPPAAGEEEAVEASAPPLPVATSSRMTAILLALHRELKLDEIDAFVS